MSLTFSYFFKPRSNPKNTPQEYLPGPCVVPNMTKASQLKKGDTLLCPKTGRTEKVLFNRRYGFQRLVRTSRHDHYFEPDTELALQSAN